MILVNQRKDAVDFDLLMANLTLNGRTGIEFLPAPPSSVSCSRSLGRSALVGVTGWLVLGRFSKLAIEALLFTVGFLVPFISSARGGGG